jgi:kynurenine formamidase
MARIVDLGLPLTDGLVSWNVKPPFRLLPYANAATSTLGFSTKLIVMEDHCGTHVDAPYHFYDGEHRQPRGRTISELPLERLMGEAVLIDVSHKREDEPVTSGLLEAAAGDQKITVRRGDIVLVRFWPGKWGEPRDKFFATRGLSLDACEWLLDRGVKCVGVDHPNLEGLISPEHGNLDSPGHLLLLHPNREIPIIENLVGLDVLRGARFAFTALPLRMEGATGSPVRPIATLEDR